MGTLGREKWVERVISIGGGKVSIKGGGVCLMKVREVEGGILVRVYQRRLGVKVGGDY